MGSILDFLFPPRCIFCRGLLKKGEADICAACAVGLPETEGAGAVQTGEFFEYCMAPFYYTGPVRSAIHRFKFRGKAGYGAYLAGRMAKCVRENCREELALVTWVPISKKRLRRRGYNQSQILAEALSKELNLPAEPTLEKMGDNPPQSSLQGAERRRANVLNMYRCLPGQDISGKRILLVDDGVTTGATLSECARELLMAGAEAVFCCTVARSRK